jgi:hypothetical protein
MHLSEAMKKDGLAKLIGRYARRHREGKSRMLDELCEDHGYERKYAIKLLGAGGAMRDPNRVTSGLSPWRGKSGGAAMKMSGLGGDGP